MNAILTGLTIIGMIIIAVPITGPMLQGRPREVISDWAFFYSVGVTVGFGYVGIGAVEMLMVALFSYLGF